MMSVNGVVKSDANGGGKSISCFHILYVKLLLL